MVCGSEEEIELVRESSLLVGKTLAEVCKNIRPGVSTLYLDKLAEEFILSHQAKPGFKGYNKYPFTLCVSVNEAVVHGMPSNYELKEGDIVSVDCGVLKHGYYGDSAYTFPVGEISLETKRLLEITKQSLLLGIEKAVVGNRTGDIGNAVQEHVEKHGCTIVRELVGHGVGKNLHEDPEVPNYGRKGSGAMLKENMVIAIEPMVNLGIRNVKQLSDGWTVVTKDGKPSAHFEHTVLVKKGKADVLSSFEEIEKLMNYNI